MNSQVIAERQPGGVWVGHHFGRKLRETRNRHLLTSAEVVKWSILLENRRRAIEEVGDFEESLLPKEVTRWIEFYPSKGRPMRGWRLMGTSLVSNPSWVLQKK